MQKFKYGKDHLESKSSGQNILIMKEIALYQQSPTLLKNVWTHVFDVI